MSKRGQMWRKCNALRVACCANNHAVNTGLTRWGNFQQHAGAQAEAAAGDVGRQYQALAGPYHPGVAAEGKFEFTGDHLGLPRVRGLLQLAEGAGLETHFCRR